MSTYTCERTKLYYKSEIPNLVGYTIEIEPVAEEEVVEEEAIPTCSDGQYYDEFTKACLSNEATKEDEAKVEEDKVSSETTIQLTLDIPGSTGDSASTDMS